MVVVIEPSRVGAKTLFSFGDLADSTENIAPDGMEQAADVGAPGLRQNFGIAMGTLTIRLSSGRTIAGDCNGPRRGAGHSANPFDSVHDPVGQVRDLRRWLRGKAPS
jgi:hypothetical protein